MRLSSRISAGFGRLLHRHCCGLRQNCRRVREASQPLPKMDLLRAADVVEEVIRWIIGLSALSHIGPGRLGSVTARGDPVLRAELHDTHLRLWSGQEIELRRPLRKKVVSHQARSNLSHKQHGEPLNGFDQYRVIVVSFTAVPPLVLFPVITNKNLLKLWSEEYGWTNNMEFGKRTVLTR